MFKLLTKLSFLLALVIGSLCNANTVVRLNIQQGTVAASVDLKLFDEEKPISVSNFMSYVRDGSYNNSFFHRSIPGFILQGGGYTYGQNNLDLPITALTISELTIPDKGTIDNEPGISNLRGTIAMARPAGQINGATSEWFINLDDANTTNLSPMDGGADAYTVFGEVLNDGMQVIDSVVTLPIVPLGGPFNEIPLADYLVGPVLISNLVRITNAEGLVKISQDHDFGIVTPQSNLQPQFFIENISNQNILIGNVGNSDPIEDPFKILGLRCDNSILAPGDKCAFAVAFNSPETNLFNTYTDSFNIEFPELGLDYTINVTGEGGAQVDEPDISLASSTTGFRYLDYGDVDIDISEIPIPYYLTLGYQNRGLADLNISSIDIVTSQPDEFSIQGSCLDNSLLEKNKFCILTLEFIPLSLGEKTAVIRIISDDPDEGVFDVTFNATVVEENDGVDAFIEDAGPNNGDGNYDGILDSKQSNVVSLPDSNGRYVTLTGSSEISYRDVRFTDRSEYPVAPNNVATTMGVLEFTVADLNVNEKINVGMILPGSIRPASYYVYGPTDNSVQSDWFEFSLDTISGTGAKIISGGSIVTEDGKLVSGTFVTLFLTNAIRGDSDFKADSEVKVIGAFYVPPSSDGSGYLHSLELCFIFFIITGCRIKFRQ